VTIPVGAKTSVAETKEISSRQNNAERRHGGEPPGNQTDGTAHQRE
jgi:hypothetical protein